jgi:hypothetical protein
MTPHDPDPEPDPELSRLLQDWSVPALPDSLDERVKTLFRSRAPRVPLWRRFFLTSIRVPLPAAVAVFLLLLTAAFWPSSESGRRPREVDVESQAPTLSAHHQKVEGFSGSLAGFEPVSQMNVTVLAESGTQ